MITIKQVIKSIIPSDKNSEHWYLKGIAAGLIIAIIIMVILM